MIKNGLTITILMVILHVLPVSAQRIAKWNVQTSGKELFSTPLSIDLDAVTFVAENDLSLFEITGGKKAAVPFQIEASGGRKLVWLQKPSKNTNRVYELLQTRGGQSPAGTLNAAITDGTVTLQNGSRNLLRYNYKTVYPPAGVDTAYRRSGFIHPLWTPSGEALTRINAKDHYHHWGMWNPWTHVLFEKDTLDFWNLKDKKGTVRFAGFASIYNGPVFSGYRALHEHIAFKKDGTEKVALNELQTVTIYQPESVNAGYYIMDITVELSCAGNSPVKLLEYRYGGLGIRATEAWNKDNSIVYTSEGKNRKEADGSTARWCVVEGQLNRNYGGFAMMSYPANYNYPEPLRVWPENSNGRGDVFVNFSPTKNKDWLLEPGKQYLLKYRFLVFDNKLGPEKAEQAWKSFANPSKIIIHK